MLLASDLKLRTSRLEAAQQQLATEAKEHEAETELQQKQLVQLKVKPARMAIQTHGSITMPK
jgi:hypothetical protein